MDEEQPRRIVRSDVRVPGSENKLAFVLDNVFSEEECKELIDLAEKKGFDKALLNVGNGQEILAEDVRKSDRCIIDSDELKENFFSRIKPYLPE
jgi:hypothetical protein